MTAIDARATAMTVQQPAAARRSLGRTLGMGLVLALALGLSACANQLAEQNGLSQLGPDGKPVTPGTPREFTARVGDTVVFTTDSSALSDEARQILSAQAGWLNKYPQFTITLEGHADERGTREYNIALGARRAETVRTYLISQGVAAARMRTISFGKERPVATCNDISCWSRNRRVQTVLNQRAGS